MERIPKTKLLSYMLISAISFSYLVLPRNAGISVPIFVLIQFFCLLFVTPKKKPLLMFVPIFILALNTFTSGNPIWHLSNFFVTLVLYSVMTLLMVNDFPIKELSPRFIANTIERIIMPINFIHIPVKWCTNSTKQQSTLIKRILLGVIISVPCLIILIVVLSSADEIFYQSIGNIVGNILERINFSIFYKALGGIFVGLYLFGLMYSSYQQTVTKEFNMDVKNGDTVVINIFLSSILTVYTLFVAIQFKYLFASHMNLPYGLTFTTYARRGFFELLFLTIVNILLILLFVHLTKENTSMGATISKGLCCYLCILTFILLVSSFYRMWLYNMNNGLTRLRFLVFGFLIFEAIGLLFTLVYIVKPKFNIIAVYLCIGLIYYLALNIVPMDSIIAKDQINRYLQNKHGGISYTLSLSSDAAPQIARLLNSETTPIQTKKEVIDYFICLEEKNRSTVAWQSYNLSYNKSKKYFNLIQHANAETTAYHFSVPFRSHSFLQKP